MNHLRSPTVEGRHAGFEAPELALEHQGIQMIISSEGEPAETLNGRVHEAFIGGSRAVLLTMGPVVLTPSVTALFLAAFSKTAEAAVISGRVSEPLGGSSRLQSDYWWSAGDAAWRRNDLLDWRRSQAALELEPCHSPALDVALIPRVIWERVGPFDCRFQDHLGDLEWCIRVRKAGYMLYHGLNILSENRHTATIRTPVAPFQEVYSTLLLARLHAAPAGLASVALHRLAHDVMAELERVEFDADYGVEISSLRRHAWYVRNLLMALRRPRMRSSIATTLRAFGAALRPPKAPYS